MKFLMSIVAFSIAMCGSLFAQQRVSSGKLVEFKNFNSKYVKGVIRKARGIQEF